MTKKFTQASVQSALRRRSDSAMTPGRHADHEVAGLALVVGRRSARWVYSYKPHGVNPETGARWSTRDLTLGVPAQMSLPEARTEALQAKAQVSRGEDPHGARMLQVGETVATRAKEVMTVAVALSRYEGALLEVPTPLQANRGFTSPQSSGCRFEAQGRSERRKGLS